MLRIDAHQHFWKFDAGRDSWITEDMQAIRRDFGPSDLGPLLKTHRFDGCVAVQADQSEAENRFLLEQAAGHDFIKGIVGWVDLQAVDIEHKLHYYRGYPLMKGFRHVLQGETDRAFMLKPAFLRGISKLAIHDYTYDILVYPDQLQHVTSLVTSFPEQRFVIDHIAKPPIKSGDINEWKYAMTHLATYENVYCKISGMVTEADRAHWTLADFRPYLDVVVEGFGIHRIMYGSDWPVCLVAGSYERMLGIVEDYFSAFSPHEQDLFFGGNAVKFYKLK